MRNKADRSGKAAVFIIFIIYIGLLLYFLFFSDTFGRTEIYSEYRYSLKPFSEISRFFYALHKGQTLTFVINILGNIFIFTPFGFFVPFLFYGTGGDTESGIGFIGLLVISVFFSLAVELLQLITRVGVFDVDDIIMNTLGAVIGYLIYLPVERMKEKKRDRERQQRD